MRIYLDVSCLDRPYDDQTQLRIRLEAEAVISILGRVESGEWSHISSAIAVIEIQQTRDRERRERLLALLPPPHDIISLSLAARVRTAEWTG